MTEKEEKAIKYLNEFIEELQCDINMFGFEDDCEEEQNLLVEQRDNFKTILNMLEQKDKEISELKAKYDKNTHILQNQLDLANADNIEKNKIIKTMAKYLNSTDIDEDICKTVSKEFDCTLYQNENFCINCIIGYFKRKVREENEC